MNIEKFTDRAKGFLQSAQTVALRMNHQRITPEHLLKALLEDEQGMAAGLIAAAGGRADAAIQATDAALAKPALLKVCQMAFGGLYRTLAPALTLYDGDLVVALASGERRADPHQVGVLAEEAVARAVLVAARAADGFGLLPAVRDLPPPR